MVLVALVSFFATIFIACVRLVARKDFPGWLRTILAGLTIATCEYFALLFIAARAWAFNEQGSLLVMRALIFAAGLLLIATRTICRLDWRRSLEATFFCVFLRSVFFYFLEI